MAWRHARHLEWLEAIVIECLNSCNVHIASYSLVPRPLPDFISQMWDKIWEWPGNKANVRTLWNSSQLMTSEFSSASESTWVNFYVFTAVCDPLCQNGGQCLLPGQCTCPPGWLGNLCEIGTIAQKLYLRRQLIDSCVLHVCSYLQSSMSTWWTVHCKWNMQLYRRLDWRLLSTRYEGYIVWVSTYYFQWIILASTWTR